MTKFQSLFEELQSKKHLTIKHLFDSPAHSLFLSIQDVLNSSNARQILYHAQIQNTIIPLCLCGQQLAWHADLRQYRKYCSNACTAKYSVADKKIKNLATLGTEWHSQTSQWRDKVCQTNLTLYGTEYYSQSAQGKQRVKDSLQAKYGVAHHMHLPYVKKQIENTCLERYGVTNPAKSQQVQNQIAKTCLEKYGVSNVLKSAVVKEKIKNSLMLRFGVDNPRKNTAIAAKGGNTKKVNYYPAGVLSKLNNASWLAAENQQGKTVGQIAAELGVSSSNLCKYFHQHKINIVYHPTSAAERQLYQYYAAQGIPIQSKNKTILAPKELDLYFYQHQFAVEINGAYWHTEKQGKNRFYHINKLTSCENQGIELYHIWDWELDQKNAIVTSMINNRLGISHRIAARKTTISCVSTQEKQNFLLNNHIQGPAGSSINLGLYNQNGQLVMLACFGISRFSKKYNFELVRLCSQLNTTVVGGASKLLTYFVKNYMQPTQTLVSYCDRRYSQGRVYAKLGFTKLHITEPGYSYVTASGVPAGSRQQWQKHHLKSKLKTFDPQLTEWQNMQLNGYERLWDCGQLVFGYTKL